MPAVQRKDSRAVSEGAGGAAGDARGGRGGGDGGFGRGGCGGCGGDGDGGGGGRDESGTAGETKVLESVSATKSVDVLFGNASFLDVNNSLTFFILDASPCQPQLPLIEDLLFLS